MLYVVLAIGAPDPGAWFYRILTSLEVRKASGGPAVGVTQALPCSGIGGVPRLLSRRRPAWKRPLWAPN